MGESRLVQAVKEYLKGGLVKGLSGARKISGLEGVMSTAGREFQRVEWPWEDCVMEPWKRMQRSEACGG